jgi:hypothetical protein
MLDSSFSKSISFPDLFPGFAFDTPLKRVNQANREPVPAAHSASGIFPALRPRSPRCLRHHFAVTTFARFQWFHLCQCQAVDDLVASSVRPASVQRPFSGGSTELKRAFNGGSTGVAHANTVQAWCPAGAATVLTSHFCS